MARLIAVIGSVVLFVGLLIATNNQAGSDEDGVGDAYKASSTVCLRVNGEGLAEGEPIPGWNVLIDPNATMTTVVATANPDAIVSGNRGVKVNGDYYLGKALDIVASGKVTINYWHFPKPGSSTNSAFAAMGPDGDTDPLVVVLKNDEDLWVANGVVVATYSGQYTPITISIDTNTGRYDLSIDEVEVVSQGQVQDMDAVAQGVYYVSFHSGRAGVGTDSFFDDLVITCRGWERAYETLFLDSYGLTLLREYRDSFLTKTLEGRLYTTLLYQNSKKALDVLLDNPELMQEAKNLIQVNRGAVEAVLDGNEGTIYNSDEIASFLSTFARKAPADLSLLAIAVKKEMIQKQKQGKKFLGFWLD
jgi:hypothetical protein